MRRDVNGARRIFRIRTLLFQGLACLVALSGVAAFHTFHQVARLRAEMVDDLRRNEERLERLQSQLEFDSERRRLRRLIHDAILRTRPGGGSDRAFELATLALEASEKYPRVDPLLLVAVGIVESGYDVDATSRAGARGLYQISPSTGRLLARKLGWEFDETMLYDPATNTEMAARYLDLLATAYKDVGMILAEYNGGPLNAGYFRAKAKKLAVETRNYVPRVIAVYERLERGMEVAALPTLAE